MALPFLFGAEMSTTPQLENGYTRIANELLEAKARIRISGEENQIWEVILRQTYGYNKKTDAISLSQFELKTGLKKPNICRAIKNLLNKNMIIKIDNAIIKIDNANCVSYCIQKDYGQWKPLSKLIKPPKAVIKIDNKSLSKVIPTKDNIQKKDILLVSKKKPARKETNPDIRKFLDWWYERYKREFGEKYPIDGKDARLTQLLLKQFSLDGLIRLAEVFWQAQDEFIRNAGHTIAVFYSQRVKLMERAKRNG